jgi:nifR3 family TIM-barrel protein
MRGPRPVTKDMSLRSEINADVPVAAPGEFRPLLLTQALSVWPPVVLAPMAGVTNPPFRALCRRQGAGLYVAEMLHARGLTEENARTLKLASFGADEEVRSIQIFGAEPQEMHAAARYLVDELGVQHIDVNMGCPVRKITARGGGSALPARPELMRAVMAAVVRGARGRGGAPDVPVTVKIRLGLDDALCTWPDALAAAQDTGMAWIAVHARTAAALYSGKARWEEIARMKERATIPVLGNGDIWEPFDAMRMLRQTGCDGVVIGRGCLGRPWLFRELADVFDGREPADPPRLGDVLAILREHGTLLVDFFGERRGVLELRKWCGWYTKGFAGSAQVRAALQRIETLDELDRWLDELDPAQDFPRAALRVSRAKRGGSQDKVSLPAGWLDLGERERARAGERAATGAATGAATAGVASGAPTEENALPSETCGESR